MRYVALGSSMAAGPGITPVAAGSPRRAARSARNYPHLVAADLGLDLVDATYSGATTAHLLTESQHGAPPQLTVLDGTEGLVTITIGGNDLGYVGGLVLASLPAPLRLVARVLPGPRRPDPGTVPGRLEAVVREAQRRAPAARVVLVDYLTLLPPAGHPTPGLPAEAADRGRAVAAELADVTAGVAARTGCELVRASAASVDHHPWADEPWTTAGGLPRRGQVPFHPNAAGMRAVADLVIALPSQP